MKTDYYQNKSQDYGMSHTRLRRILNISSPLNGKKVLDVGCGNGRLGEELKKLGAEVCGIETSETAANQAHERIDEVFIADIEKKWPEQILLENFDLIILAEVLEHMFDPVRVLKQASACLKRGGGVVITTPNFMTWTNRLKFLFGKFKYKDQGMFDFGHIRWFTYTYLKDVIKNAGLVIEEESHIIFPGKLTFILKRWPSFFAWQFVIKAKRS